MEHHYPSYVSHNGVLQGQESTAFPAQFDAAANKFSPAVGSTPNDGRPLLSLAELALLYPVQNNARRKAANFFALRFIALSFSLGIALVAALCIL